MVLPFSEWLIAGCSDGWSTRPCSWSEGAHQLTTLQRAKEMLEQSDVAIAGVIVNSLSDDVHNWSSYGYDGAMVGGSARTLNDSRGPTASWTRRRQEAMVLAGASET